MPSRRCQPADPGLLRRSGPPSRASSTAAGPPSRAPSTAADPPSRVSDAPQHGGALIALRVPGDRPGPSGHDVEISVVPGERVSVLARVRNQSDIVDNYEIGVDGVPRDWWSVPKGTAYLVPLGSGGEYEQDVEIVLHPPRTPAAVARRWSLHVGLRSRARGGELARAPLTLVIQPFTEVALVVTPQRATQRLRASYEVTVANDANAPVSLALEGT